MSRLGILGGRDTAEANRRILVQVISNDLAKGLNWVGGVKKRSILDFPNVLQLISGNNIRDILCSYSEMLCPVIVNKILK